MTTSATVTGIARSLAVFVPLASGDVFEQAVNRLLAVKAKMVTPTISFFMMMPFLQRSVWRK
jgi:hypothetical protein